MKKIIIYIFGCILLFGCNADGLLDEMETGGDDLESTYSNVESTRKALNDLYGRMRETTNANSGSFSRLMDMGTTVAMLDNATDDGGGNTTRPQGVPGIAKFLNSGILATTNPVTNTHPWTFYYNAIRNANIFMENVDYSPMTSEEKYYSKNQARFLRAYYYHELFRWFGALVISEKVESPMSFDAQRESIERTVRYIASEFDALAQPGMLPDTEWSDPVDYGRVTRAAALAYKARTLLYGASPLHQESGVTWAEAAKAAEDLIGKNWFQLYTDSDEPAKSYSRLFNTRVNSETILAYQRGYNNDLYNLMPGFGPWNLNKEVTTAPTQWLVDCYDMIDGTEPIIGYVSNTTPIINPAATTYDEQNPYTGRDPRLNQTILHDGSIWPKINNTSNVKMDISTPNAWGMGYFLAKYLDDRIDHRLSAQNTSQNFQLIRYAEVLLNYAEAINEAENSAAARAKAVDKLNQIRSRAGITGTLDANNFTQETLRKRIWKERRVELCFEEHRFFDIRRWKIAKDVMALPAVGIVKENGLYVRKERDTRSYNEKLNLMPIPDADVKNCPGIKQNPGY